ncbi:alpha/beta fold hydrolase [Spirosoma linguale]|uniref:Alpha/beta hydrolase fold protein n=1 Tax=Spirosoma linguale (strain ATCC 33905 / DSM 74 / LMG 10896 / Claus 1) TaxID=504472 RepID=D2QKW4_SPILD|nr:alpha/beta hydrolase fold protein [Spirosoma linguale DSM 74]
MSQRSLLCLIHGHGVDASIWGSVYADLALDHQVLTPDFSRLTHLTTIEAYADALYDQLALADGQKVILAGHSMGGYIALAFAEKHPDRVQGLVLYHSTAVADDEAKRQARQQVIQELRTSGTQPFIHKQMPKMVAPSYAPERIEALEDRFRNLPAEALIAGIKAIANRPDRTAVIRDARFPVLLILGRDDQLIPYEKTAQLADLSSRIKLVTIEQAGHLSMVEQPAQSTAVLRDFGGQF